MGRYSLAIRSGGIGVCACMLHCSVVLPGLPKWCKLVKNPSANTGDTRNAGSIPGSGGFPGGGNDSPLQFSCLENPVDRGAWQAAVHGVTQRVGPD